MKNEKLEMKNEKYKTLSPLPLKGGEPVYGMKSPFKGDLEGLVFYDFSFFT